MTKPTTSSQKTNDKLGELFTIHIADKEWIFLICRVLHINKKKDQQLNRKMTVGYEQSVYTHKK